MRLLGNALLLFSIVSFATLAHGKKKSSRPTVVVMDIRVNSTNPAVQAKIVELTAKVRDQISAKTKECNVIGTRKMRKLMRQHRKKMASCYDDCGVEFGLLVGADFVITGHLEPSTSEILAVIQIQDTRTRNTISTKKVRGANYFELERTMISAVRRIVKPLNNVVIQATDDEMARGTPSSYDEEGGSSAGSQPESEYLAPTPEEEPEEELTKLGERWEEAQNAPPLIDSGDDEAPLLGLGLGVNVGYSINVDRSRTMKEAYSPVLHVGFQAYYQLHPLVQIAIVGDMDFLSGNVVSTVSIYEFTYVYDQDLDLESETNVYVFKKYNTVGIRPTVRLTAPIQIAELFLGVGLGFNYVSTSGSWEKVRHGDQYYQEGGNPPREDLSEDVPYNYEISSFNFYAALDFGLMFRVLDKRLGIGALVQYKMPSMWRSGTKAKAVPDTYAMETEEPPFTTPSTDDTINSPIRHLDSLDLLTFAGMLDWRF